MKLSRVRVVWVLAAGACLLAGRALADDTEKAAELQKLMNSREEGAVKKFFTDLKPADRKGVIREYTKEEVLDKALDKLLQNLVKAFGELEDETGQKSPKPYDIYLNCVLKGMKDKDGKEYQDTVINEWAVKQPDSDGLPIPPGKKAALKEFLAAIGIHSLEEFEKAFGAPGKPETALAWIKRFGNGSLTVAKRVFSKE